MEKALPSNKDIDALTAFLPRLHIDGFDPVMAWHGGPQQNSFPWPEYQRLVREFIGAASRPSWIDYKYDAAEARLIFEDGARMAKASLVELRSVVTYFVRAERFCDGFWAGAIKDGRVRRLLERLKQIRAES